MGCDIHLYAEQKNGTGWVTADEWKVDEDEPGRMEVPCDSRFYSGRNYNLFSILADVRNGHGFAGIDTGDGYPIAPPRGLPDDVTPEVKTESDGWGRDGHSHSWLTLQELLAYDWTQTSLIRGVLSAREFVDWDRWGRQRGEAPKNWCGSISGGVVKNIAGPQLAVACEGLKVFHHKELEAAIRDRGLSDTYAPFHWEQPYYRVTSGFWSEAIPRLLRLGDPADVRIVFWFDN